MNNLVNNASDVLDRHYKKLGKENSKNIDAINAKVTIVTDVMNGILERNDRLLNENAALHIKLDNANDMLVKARKRAGRYFKTSIVISLAGIGIGVATRYGYFDNVKDWFAKSKTQPQIGLSLDESKAATPCWPVSVCLSDTPPAICQSYRTQRRAAL